MLQDIDSEKPIMQVGQYWFAGEYEGRSKGWPHLLQHRRERDYYLFIDPLGRSPKEIAIPPAYHTTQCLSKCLKNMNRKNTIKPGCHAN